MSLNVHRLGPLSLKFLNIHLEKQCDENVVEDDNPSGARSGVGLAWILLTRGVFSRIYTAQPCFTIAPFSIRYLRSSSAWLPVLCGRLGPLEVAREAAVWRVFVEAIGSLLL